MKRTTLVGWASLSCAILILAGAWPAYGELEGGKKGPSRKELKGLMAKAHRGDKSPLASLGKELKAEAPDWAEVGKNAKLLTDMADVLQAAQPHAAGRYHTSAHALDRAARGKDRAAATAALLSLRKSCSSCHYGYPALSSR